MEALTIAAVALTALGTWLSRERRYPGPRLVADEPDIDRATLEAAERDARAAPPLPPDGPRPPERL